MKGSKLKFVIACCIIGVSFMVMNSCKKTEDAPTPTTIPFQGPKNASFENISGNEWFISQNQYGQVYYTTGTGFLPSNGVEYMQFLMQSRLHSSSSLPSTAIYQDGIDLTHSSSMTFDYTFTYTPYIGHYLESTTVQILFTSNGTVTLWQQTIDSTSTLPIQKLNQTITLPSTTSAGRLTIQTYGSSLSPNNQTPIHQFCIDNIRVN